MECRNKEVAVQCDLQSDTLLPLMKDTSTQTGQLHPPVHSSPILLLQSQRYLILKIIITLETHHTVHSLQEVPLRKFSR